MSAARRDAVDQPPPAGGWFARAAATVRRIIGAPDYAAYVAHVRACHPDHRGRDFSPLEFALTDFDHSVTRFALTGQHATDVTNASRTMLMNLKTLDWDAEILKVMGIPRSMLPEIKSSSEIYGHVGENPAVFQDAHISIRYKTRPSPPAEIHAPEVHIPGKCHVCGAVDPPIDKLKVIKRLGNVEDQRRGSSALPTGKQADAAPRDGGAA